MGEIAKKITVYGRVQGVGFRQFTALTAEKLNIHGTVKNLSNGAVECYAKGTQDNIEKFINHLRKGPPLAKVTQIEIEDTSPLYLTHGFKIIY